MTSDRLAGYSRLMATLTLLLIAGMLLLNAASWIFPDLASEHGLGFALTATGVAGDLGVAARDMPLWQALGGILLSSLPLLVLASGLQALRRLFQHYGRGEYFCEEAAALLGKVGLCLACWVLANFLLGHLPPTPGATHRQSQLRFGGTGQPVRRRLGDGDRAHPAQGRPARRGKPPVRLRSAMPIEIRLDVMLALRKARSKDLAQAIGITEQNLSLLKQGKVKGIRLATLEAICAYLACQPGNLLEYLPGPTEE